MECAADVVMMKRKIDFSHTTNISDAKMREGSVGDVDDGSLALVLLLVMAILEVVASGWW